MAFFFLSVWGGGVAPQCGTFAEGISGWVWFGDRGSAARRFCGAETKQVQKNHPEWQ